MKRYVYGMRARGFSPLCQPMNGLLDHWESPDYYCELEYDRRLTEDEIREYELDYIGEENDAVPCFGTDDLGCN